jgi:hypothetical protein
VFAVLGSGIVTLEDPSPNTSSVEQPFAHQPGFALVTIPEKVTLNGAEPDCGEATSVSAGSVD